MYLLNNIKSNIETTGIITSIFTITWVLTFVGGIMFTIKELQDRVPDLIGKVYTEGAVTVIEINHGRIKIMPKHRKHGK